MEYLVKFFAWMMDWGHQMIPNYWIDIFIFTAITKVLQFPISLWCHVNSLKMVSLMPKTNQIKMTFYGDKDKIGEETAALFKREHYHPLLSLLPLAIQIIILMGFVKVIYAIADVEKGSLIGQIPMRDGGVAWLMPLIAGAAALLLGWCQNIINPLQHEQTRAQQITTNGISIGISLFLGAYVAMGVGLYWAASNLFSILVQLWCNVTIKPKSRVDYPALYKSKSELQKLEDSLKRVVSKEDKWREKRDYKRFFHVANKHVVFYSEGSGFYKYFESLINWLLAHTNLDIHYVTQDPKDQIFSIAEKEPRIKPYYIGAVKIIPLMMKMDADIVVMTTPDLGKYQIKRSYVKKDVEYIYMTHGVSSVHMCLRQGAFDNYDTIFTVGPYQVEEHRKTEELYGLKAKTLVKTGYLLFDSLIKQYQSSAKPDGGRKRILIAPSYQEGNILESCIDELIEQFGKLDGVLTVVRPHPRFITHQPARMNALLAKYRNVPDEKLVFEMDFKSNSSIYDSDIVVSDWSSIAYEFSFTTKKPCILINTPMKVINPEWQKLGIEPADIWMRNGVGHSFDPDRLGEVSEVAADMLAHPDKFASQIQSLMDKSLFNPGHSCEVAGRYILDTLIARRKGK